MPNTILGIKRILRMIVLAIFAGLFVAVVDGWEHFLAMVAAALVCALLLDIVDVLVEIRELDLIEARQQERARTGQ